MPKVPWFFALKQDIVQFVLAFERTGGAGSQRHPGCADVHLGTSQPIRKSGREWQPSLSSSCPLTARILPHTDNPPAPSNTALKTLPPPPRRLPARPTRFLCYQRQTPPHFTTHQAWTRLKEQPFAIYDFTYMSFNFKVL